MQLSPESQRMFTGERDLQMSFSYFENLLIREKDADKKAIGLVTYLNEVAFQFCVRVIHYRWCYQ